ncbi:MAG: TonB-dependent receptor [Saprospiraceae bacterium]|nr:TonB-dependent receptor [Bacteroidia bacterium]NNE16537.1 TonB-dependent receptor [Saprospiraceae bacterium]NNL90769.1 TonB-dependent receptor [Saprospiraceae bacterium]
MKKLFTFLITAFSILLNAQNARITGILQDDKDEYILFANVVLYNQADSSLVKVETTDENGKFIIQNIAKGKYYLDASYLGLNNLQVEDINVDSNPDVDLGTLLMTTASVELETAIVTAKRSMVEIKPDRTVFNVQGTINSTGDNGLELLRKAPGVLVDNNNSITVLSRSGVLIYVDGKRLPLGGDDLSNYLQNLTADQIDRIDIITNPGAKYEAQGNAGIIDIRLKRNENHGLNGSVNTNITKAFHWRKGISGNLNYRNKAINTFFRIGTFDNSVRQTFRFDDFQNEVRVNNTIIDRNDSQGGNIRWGTDFFLNDNHTLGFLVSANIRDNISKSNSENFISSIATPDDIDSILVASNTSDDEFESQSYNLNYVFTEGETTVNIDADFGSFRSDSDNDQPNIYYNPDRTEILTEVNTAYVTPVAIDIYTFKVDYESNLFDGRLGLGTKLSRVETDNTFLFYDIPNSDRIRDDRRSNQFLYNENVYAAYVSYQRPLGELFKFSSGVRLEQTDATGDLIPFDEDLQEPPVELDYLSVFPNLGLTYSKNPKHVFSINYGRRINRPDYNVLNPFKSQINQLSFSKGNPFLSPEIVNNFELGYLWNYRYNIKLAYSRTTDQITRLIGPDESDPRARFINWDNLAEQITYSLNVSIPIEVTKIWNAYFNLSGSHLNNQADYGDGVTVDLQRWSYNIFQQQTIDLPGGFVGEVSGWFSGPGIWGGVFKYDTQWSLNLGLQKKFMNNKLSVKLSAQDIFHQAFWSGFSEFNGLRSNGIGEWDSRRGTLNISYNFGNEKVKSRKRQTGIEDEAGRVN